MQFFRLSTYKVLQLSRQIPHRLLQLLAELEDLVFGQGILRRELGPGGLRREAALDLVADEKLDDAARDVVALHGRGAALAGLLLRLRLRGAAAPVAALVLRILDLRVVLRVADLHRAGKSEGHTLKNANCMAFVGVCPQGKGDCPRGKERGLSPWKCGEVAHMWLIVTQWHGWMEAFLLRN